MGIRLKPGESYESWAVRVQQYEYTLALEKIAKGVSVDDALEWMSKNITAKMLHPVITELNNIPIDQAVLAESKKRYEETFIKRVPRAADQVGD
jgi:glutamyl-tRNA reductase